MASKPLLGHDVEGAAILEDHIPRSPQKKPTVCSALRHPITFARSRPLLATTLVGAAAGAILLIVLLSVYLSPDPTTRALKKGGVIPDVLGGVGIDKSTSLTVVYPAGEVRAGVELTPAEAAPQPTVTITGKGLFTLLMNDPDAPSPEMPIVSEILHWMVTNIPDGDLAAGTIVQNYTGPAPPTGIHRYVITLYRQRDDLPINVLPYASRALFSARNFIRGYGLQGPIQATYFRARPDAERAGK